MRSTMSKSLGIKFTIYAHVTVPFLQPFESGPVMVNADTAAAVQRENRAEENIIL